MKDLNIPIMDLHCDLLAYLQIDPKRTVSDESSRCSLPFLQKGNVKLQTLAIFSETIKNSTLSGQKQVEIFENIKKPFLEEGISIIPAIENASGFFEEDEPLEIGLSRLNKTISAIGPILYLSLTWNEENRFGGGNLTQMGLKEDGKHLLDFLAEKKIAIDLSHTSDQLAHDVINYIETKKLSLRPIASHSNFRKVTIATRNLPEEIAKEIIKKEGIIGLNFVRKFLGEKAFDSLIHHIDYAISIGAEDYLCFGADFFCDLDTPSLKSHSLQELLPFFVPPFENSSCYQNLLHLLKDILSPSLLQKIAHQNFERYITRTHS